MLYPCFSELFTEVMLYMRSEKQYYELVNKITQDRSYMTFIYAFRTWLLQLNFWLLASLARVCINKHSSSAIGVTVIGVYFTGFSCPKLCTQLTVWGTNYKIGIAYDIRNSLRMLKK